MIRYRVIVVDDGNDDDFDASELIGIGVMLATDGRRHPEDWNEGNVYFRAWRKLQPLIRHAIDKDT